MRRLIIVGVLVVLLIAAFVIPAVAEPGSPPWWASGPVGAVTDTVMSP
ncbi:MAG: hypothetical protein JOZ19_14245, partial [Rubrobacter sp.]|nr:hypothetical protein [Rubrobacter sp.]